MQKQMLDAINKRLVAKQTTSTTSFSITIDATEVPQLSTSLRTIRLLLRMMMKMMRARRIIQLLLRMMMTMMRARRRMMRIMMMVLMMYCPVLPKGAKHWILHWKLAKNYGKQLLTW
jgi:hypothetical protein